MSQLSRGKPSADGPNRMFVWAMRLIATVALGITAYLAWHARHGGVAGCGGGEVFDCAHVLNTRWSKIFGLPVSLPAFALYASLVTALVFVNQRVALRVREAAWALAVLLAVAAGAAAVWFISLQVFAVGKYCIYCLVAHSCGLTLAALALWCSPLSRKLTSMAAAGGITATLGLILCQSLYVAPSHELEEYAEVGPGALESAGLTDSLVQDDLFLDPLTDDDFFSSPEDDAFASPEEVELDAVIDDPEVQEATFESPLDSPSAKKAEATTTDPGSSAALERTPRRIEFWSYVVHHQGPVASLTPEPPADSTPLATAKPANADVKESAPTLRYVTILGGRAKLNARHWPMVGSPEAKNIVVELFDYTCPHCREMNEQMTTVRRRYPGQLSVITLPCPLNRSCNDGVRSTASRHIDACELARFAIAVWRIDPELFASYHEWLFQPASGRTANQARAEASRLVGDDRLNAELRKPTVNKYIAKHVALYKRAGAGTVPKLMLPRATVKGKTHSANALIGVLKTHLELVD